MARFTPGIREIEGNVGRAPTVTRTAYGMIVHARVATHRHIRGRRLTRWVPVVFTGPLASWAAAALGPGTHVRLTGLMCERRFVGRDQQARTIRRLEVTRGYVLLRSQASDMIRPATPEEMTPDPAPAPTGATRATPARIKGHERWQVYGPGRTLRKRIWIAERRRDEHTGRLVPVS